MIPDEMYLNKFDEVLSLLRELELEADRRRDWSTRSQILWAQVHVKDAKLETLAMELKMEKAAIEWFGE